MDVDADGLWTTTGKMLDQRETFWPPESLRDRSCDTKFDSLWLDLVFHLFSSTQTIF